MAEAAGEGGAGSEGVGIEAAIEAIENAPAGSVSMGIGDITGTAFESGGSIDTAAAGSISMGIPGSVTPDFAQAPSGFGSAGVPDALDIGGGAASATMGLAGGMDTGYAGGEPGRPGSGQGGPAPEKPRAADMRDEALMGPADRRRRVAQRADAASVTLTDNDAYLLGGTSAKRKDARRVLLGP